MATTWGQRSGWATKRNHWMRTMMGASLCWNRGGEESIRCITAPSPTLRGLQSFQVPHGYDKMLTVYRLRENTPGDVSTTKDRRRPLATRCPGKDLQIFSGRLCQIAKNGTKSGWARMHGCLPSMGRRCALWQRSSRKSILPRWIAVLCRREFAR